MTISKTDVLAFVNDRLGRAETDIDKIIIAVCKNISERLDCIEDTATISAVAGTVSYAWPTLCKRIVSVVRSSDNMPLEKIAWREYRDRIYENSSQNTPEYWTYRKGLLYVYPTPNASVSLAVNFWKLHAESASTIELPDRLRQAVNLGATKELAYSRQMYDDAARMEILYEKELYEIEANLPRDVKYSNYQDV